MCQQLCPGYLSDSLKLTYTEGMSSASLIFHIPENILEWGNAFAVLCLYVSEDHFFHVTLYVIALRTDHVTVGECSSHHSCFIL